MPTNITDSSSFDTATAPTASDIRNAAGMLAFLQALANRTRFLFDRHEPLANIAALQAITSPANNLVRMVEGYGVYIFDSASSDPEALPWIVAPGAGSGRWIHSMASMQSTLLQQLVLRDITTTGTWVSTVTGPALLFGWGGGGGGGGGKPNSTSDNRWISGGGGGGGAWPFFAIISLVAGTTYEETIGAGGAGGAGGTAGTATAGADGGDSIYAEQGGAELARFRGAAGGRTPISTYLTDSSHLFRTRGGAPFKSPRVAGWGNAADDYVISAAPSGAASFGHIILPASGGEGNATGTGLAGMSNPFGGYAGGAGGTLGTASSLKQGGGGGGGGGAGPGGAGGAGGNGGNAGAAGGIGTTVGANTGAGGGGGGSGGSHATTPGDGGGAGDGGTGRMFLVFLG